MSLEKQLNSVEVTWITIQKCVYPPTNHIKTSSVEIKQKILKILRMDKIQ